MAWGEIGVPSRSNSRRGRGLHRAVVEPAEPAPRLFAAEKDVGGDGELGDEVQLLVDDPDAGVLGVARARELDRAAVEEDLAVVVGDRAGQDLHQRALARPVLAAERRGPRRRRGRRHVPQRVDPAEVLGDVPHLEARRGRSLMEVPRYGSIILRPGLGVRKGLVAAAARGGMLDETRPDASSPRDRAPESPETEFHVHRRVSLSAVRGRPRGAVERVLRLAPLSALRLRRSAAGAHAVAPARPAPSPI